MKHAKVTHTQKDKMKPNAKYGKPLAIHVKIKGIPNIFLSMPHFLPIPYIFSLYYSYRGSGLIS